MFSMKGINFLFFLFHNGYLCNFWSLGEFWEDFRMNNKNKEKNVESFEIHLFSILITENDLFKKVNF